DIMSKIKAAYPNDECEGWPFKLPEAEAILAGATGSMPYIDAEFAGSGTLYASREDLARKVLENNSTFKAVSGFINGQQTAMYHKLEDLAATKGVTAKTILGMPVEYVLPEGLLTQGGES
ncbi:hypothetical protein LJC48_07545, partial [Desulfovibrio sp. OttesenSCG-928-C06]|nr:hypothetical protein [Desulfovibrio sp. OttesenSCG-928-C06]